MMSASSSNTDLGSVADPAMRDSPGVNGNGATSGGAALPLPPVRRPVIAAGDDALDRTAAYRSRLGQTMRQALSVMTGWAASTVFHVALLLLLGLMFLPELKKELPTLLAVSSQEPLKEELDTVVLEETPLDDALENLSEAPLATPDAPVTQEVELSPLDDAPAPEMSVELADVGFESVPVADMLSEVGSFMGRGLEGRGEAARAILVAKGGGSVESEAAVGGALEWLARHQNTDGSWSFDHRMGQCQGRCRNPGRMVDAYSGATAMALLPFLGAGQTHLEGKYQKTVAAGLQFLVRRMQMSRAGGSLHEPGGYMYSHGLGAIALCEAYAMTQDQSLLAPAQASLNFIVSAQDEIGGGWRYTPGMAGDTSVVGWQVMALKSGHMAYLVVPPATIAGAERFLDSVQSHGGAWYGYTSRVTNAGLRDVQGTTSVGLLCRMLLGWGHDHPGIQRGVAGLDKLGPSERNLYYDYYATQVMHHYGGEEWDRWNSRMRDFLVRSQVKEGHEAGSWYMEDAHGGSTGGRLYCTSMACMILEVYYRHLPLYKRESLEADFEGVVTEKSDKRPKGGAGGRGAPGGARADQ